MSKYIKKDEDGFYVFDEREFLKTLPTGLEYFAVDKESEQIYGLGFNYKEKMEKQIDDLETKLAEIEKKNFELVAKINLKKHKPAFCTLADRDCDALGQVEELQKQLAEKEKEIESYKHFKITIGTMENNQVDISSTTYTDQDKISFAVEKLEKVKETTECVLDNALKNSSLNQSYYDRLLDEIDNQINELKEMR